MSTIRPPTRAEIDYSNMQKREKAIRRDIAKIDTALNENDIERVKAVHMDIDGKYQSGIADWGKSMYGYSQNYGFDYGSLGILDMKHNLSMMKSKLDGFIYGLNTKNNPSTSKSASDVNVTVNNTVNVTISFDEARKKIEDMPGLTDSETEEIKGKIDELATISREETSKKKKWEKVKPILAFALDKSVDVAVTIMGLILQMNLGM